LGGRYRPSRQENNTPGLIRKKPKREDYAQPSLQYRNSSLEAHTSRDLRERGFARNHPTRGFHCSQLRGLTAGGKKKKWGGKKEDPNAPLTGGGKAKSRTSNKEGGGDLNSIKSPLGRENQTRCGKNLEGGRRICGQQYIHLWGTKQRKGGKFRSRTMFFKGGVLSTVTKKRKGEKKNACPGWCRGQLAKQKKRKKSVTMEENPGGVVYRKQS